MRPCVRVCAIFPSLCASEQSPWIEQNFIISRLSESVSRKAGVCKITLSFDLILTRLPGSYLLIWSMKLLFHSVFVNCFSVFTSFITVENEDHFKNGSQSITLLDDRVSVFTLLDPFRKKQMKLLFSLKSSDSRECWKHKSWLYHWCSPFNNNFSERLKKTVPLRRSPRSRCALH